jgi:putative transposase
MNEYQSLNHTKWECKYHVVFIPKYRRKVLYASLRKHLGSLFRELARHKECEIGEGHLMATMCTCCCRFRQNIRYRR